MLTELHFTDLEENLAVAVMLYDCKNTLIDRIQALMHF